MKLQILVPQYKEADEVIIATTQSSGLRNTSVSMKICGTIFRSTTRWPSPIRSVPAALWKVKLGNTTLTETQLNVLLGITLASGVSF